MIFKFRYFSLKNRTLWVAYSVFYYILAVQFTSSWLTMSSEMPSGRRNLQYGRHFYQHESKPRITLLITAIVWFLFY